MDARQKLEAQVPLPDPYSYISGTAKLLSTLINGHENKKLDASSLTGHPNILEMLYRRISETPSSHSFTATTSGDATELLIDIATVIEAISLFITNGLAPRDEWEPRLESLIARMMELSLIHI